ncbi:hypothetical protein FOA52_013304 [Chlamydomonas sp. UWO 241]|nr:hypothetical protein FOA52_013304 [Chlamydomonas sp. UWO 241]
MGLAASPLPKGSVAHAPRDVWGERRALLHYILQDASHRGIKVVPPPGILLTSSSLLDSIEPNGLFRQLQGAAARIDASVELQHCCHAATAASGGVGASGNFAPGSFSASGASYGASTSAAAFSAPPPPQPYNAGGAGVIGDDAPNIPMYSLSNGTLQRRQAAAAAVVATNGGSASNPFAGSGSGPSNPFSAPPEQPNPFSSPRPQHSPQQQQHQQQVDPAAAAAAAAAASAAATAAAAAMADRHGQTSADRHGQTSADRHGQTSALPRSTPAAVALTAVNPPPVPRSNAPQLSLSQLRTGLAPGHTASLAQLVFAVGVSGEPASFSLSELLARQLEMQTKAGRGVEPDVDDGMDSDVAVVVGGCALAPFAPAPPAVLRLLRHKSTGAGSVGKGGAPGPLSLDSLLVLLQRARPTDFCDDDPSDLLSGGGAKGAVPLSAFTAYCAWRVGASAALVAGFELHVASGWASADTGAARALLARLRACVRRMAVSRPVDLDEQEFGEAGEALGRVCAQLAAGVRSGWALPWGVRVRVAEALLTAQFNGDGSYVDSTQELSNCLSRCVWPAMGLGSVLQLAVNAWVHFQQFIVTRDARLLRQLKYLMSRLLAHTEAPPPAPDVFGLGTEVVTTEANKDAAALDFELARDVGRCIIDDTTKRLRDCHASYTLPDLKSTLNYARDVGRCIIDDTTERLRDYHASFLDGEAMQGLLDVLSFAAKSRGDTDDQLHELLAGLVTSSTEAELARRVAARSGPSAGALPGGTTSSASTETLYHTLASAQAMQADAAGPMSHARALGSHLPRASQVASAALYASCGAALAPWLRSLGSLDPATLQVLHAARYAARAADKSIGAPLSAAAAAGALSGTTSSLTEFTRWDLEGPLAPVLGEWVAARCTNLTTWTVRQLSLERWVRVGDRQAHGQFAAEVLKAAHDAIDALFDLGLPLAPGVLLILLGGVSASLERCARTVTDKLGSADRLVPPAPAPTRYKKDVVVKQEKAEVTAAGLGASGGGGGGLFGGKKKEPKDVFLASVLTIQASPDFVAINEGLAMPVLLVAMHSISFLAAGAAGLAPDARRRWQDERADTAALSTASVQTGAASAADAARLDSALAAASAALARASDHATDFAAARAIFWDQRQEWLERLYRHHVASQRLDIVLDCLNSLLIKACAPMSDEVLRRRFAGALLRRSAQRGGQVGDEVLRRRLSGTLLRRRGAQAYERVLLDGGPCRWYIPADVPSLEQDLSRLAQLFHAEGAGLPVVEVDAALARVRGLLVPMALEAGPLLDILKEAKARGSASVTRRGTTTVLSEDEALRMVARRPEHVCSKLLKDQYKLGKKPK